MRESSKAATLLPWLKKVKKDCQILPDKKIKKSNGKFAGRNVYPIELIT
jgi:hypothetical protein